MKKGQLGCILYTDMYIRFKLPTGAGGMAALHASKNLRERMQLWADRHNIKITSVHTGYTMTFKLTKDSDYTVFALSWQTLKSWDHYELVDD